ncbi:MAG: hypothetical protein VXX85_02280 [Candidatus Margulisiibacteriota bacterium]|nr:hypothetical protein [Candidatus Margulisiibacteriota bacterium]
MFSRVLSSSCSGLPRHAKRLFTNQPSKKIDVSIKQYVAAFGGPRFETSTGSIRVKTDDLISALKHAKLHNIDNRTSSEQALALNSLAVKAGLCEEGTYVNSLLGPSRTVILASR